MLCSQPVRARTAPATHDSRSFTRTFVVCPAVFSSDLAQVNQLLDAATQRGDLAALLGYPEPTLNDSTALHVRALSGANERAPLRGINGTHPRFHPNRVQIAVGEGEGDIAAALIQRGAPVNAADGNGALPMHHLATFDGGDHSDSEEDEEQAEGADATVDTQSMLAQLMMEKGASLDAADAQQRTVLHAAAEAQNVPMCQLLLAMGANANAVDAEVWPSPTPPSLPADITPSLPRCGVHGPASPARSPSAPH